MCSQVNNPSFQSSKIMDKKFLCFGWWWDCSYRMQSIGTIPVKIGVMLSEILTLWESWGIVVPWDTTIKVHIPSMQSSRDLVHLRDMPSSYKTCLSFHVKIVLSLLHVICGQSCIIVLIFLCICIFLTSSLYRCKQIGIEDINKQLAKHTIKEWRRQKQKKIG